MKRVKEFVILWILLIGTIGINAQDNDVANKADLEITAIPPVVTISLDGASTERTFSRFFFVFKKF